MERDLLRLIQACVAMVVLFVTAFILFTMFPAMKSEEAAAWVGAIGTVGTLGGTIWIASSEWRQKRSEALALAMISASDMCWKVDLMRGRMKQALALLQKSEEGIPEAFNGCSNLLKAPLWEAEDLVVFASLPKRCATRLAHVRHMVLLLRQVFERETTATDRFRVRSMGRLEESIEHCDFALEALRDILRIDIEERILE